MVPDYRRYVRAKKKLKKLKAKQNQAKENFNQLNFLGHYLVVLKAKEKLKKLKAKARLMAKEKLTPLLALQFHQLNHSYFAVVGSFLYCISQITNQVWTLDINSPSDGWKLVLFQDETTLPLTPSSSKESCTSSD